MCHHDVVVYGLETVIKTLRSDVKSVSYPYYNSKMKKNFSSQLIHSVIEPFLVPRKAGVT